MVIQDLPPSNSILPYQPIHQPSTVTTETFEYDENGRVRRRIVTTSTPQRINPNYCPSHPGLTVWYGTGSVNH